MYCPICDQKPMNCDCTAEERRQYGEIEDLEYEIDRLRLEIDRLRLTDAEREAVAWVCGDVADITVPIEDALRGLLERHFPAPKNQPPQDNTPHPHTTPREGSVPADCTKAGEK